MYLNLDALTSSSNEESLYVNKCEDLAVTVVCKSEGIVTHVNSNGFLLNEDLLAVFGAWDIRQVIWRRDRPSDGPTRRTARSNCRQEPSAPAVDLVTGKCNPGKVSSLRTVSTSPPTLDMTVVCIPEPEIFQPMAITQGALLPDTVNKTVAGLDTSTPAVATPATMVGKPGPQSDNVLTLRPPTCFRCSDYRPRPPRLPHPRCRGAWQRTHFHPTGCGRDCLRTAQARVVCLMCDHFHRDSSYDLHGRAEQPRLKGFCYQRCCRILMIRFWAIRSLKRELNSFRGQNPHCHCLYAHGRRNRPC